MLVRQRRSFDLRQRVLAAFVAMKPLMGFGDCDERQGSQEPLCNDAIGNVALMLIAGVWYSNWLAARHSAGDPPLSTELGHQNFASGPSVGGGE
jgi:hypothetical protein